ncbi:hypothetical protein [uncultured Campylobacter sp.]|jgi:hypothetical protein|uniref:hypothetical protein n=1 Tax=uncultured Campylobacter sp. TaxID=218934 RepID=UPI002609A358|nr:hypothetical protein [uncultured Campylobacter sp.]
MASFLSKSPKSTYFNKDFSKTEKELNELFDHKSLKIELTDGLQNALDELSNLHSKLPENQTSTLLHLCEASAISAITSQFGLASLIIDARDGGSVTTVHNFEKGITANEADAARYSDMIANRNGKYLEVRNKVGYDKPLVKRRNEALQNEAIIIDEYTGRNLPKYGRVHLDHIVSVKEIESSVSANLALSPEERAKIAADKENLALIDGSINQSKGSDEMKVFLNKEDKKTGQRKAEKFGIDEQKAMQKDKKARKFVYGEIDKAKVKKYSKELLTTGCKDITKIMAYTVIGVAMREIAQGAITEIKLAFKQRGKESFGEIWVRFKTRMSEILDSLKSKWKDLVAGSIEKGLTSFISNLGVFLINVFATTLKRFVAMIRAGFVSLKEAVKILVNPPRGLDKDEVGYQAVKVLTAGLIGALSLGLSEAIDKFLLSIPVLTPIFSFIVPVIGKSVGDIVSTCLSAILGGVLTTIVIYFMDKLHSQSKADKIQIQLVTKSGEISAYQVALSWVALSEAYDEFFVDVKQSITKLANTIRIVRDSSQETSMAVSNFIDKMQNLRIKLNKTIEK